MTTHEPTNIYTFLTRQHVAWIAFYVVLLGSVFAYTYAWYTDHDENQLPSGHIELVMSTTTYQLGEVVEFTVFNHFPTPVYVRNHCPEEPLSVFRWEGEKWVELHDTMQGGISACATQERDVAIPTEDSRTYNFSKWSSLFTEPGVYRIALVVDHYTEIPFQDFVILKPAEVIEVMEEPIYKTVPSPATPSLPVPVVPVVPEVVEEVVPEEVEEIEEELEVEREEEEGHEEREEEDDD